VSSEEFIGQKFGGVHGKARHFVLVFLFLFLFLCIFIFIFWVLKMGMGIVRK
jgi:hypothetical protein